MGGWLQRIFFLQVPAHSFVLWMISIQTILKIDPSLINISVKDLEILKTDMYEIAQLAFEVYWSKKHGSKYPVGSFPSPEIETKL